MAYFHYLDPEVIELTKELTSGYHKELLVVLSELPPDEHLAAIAASCDIALDGMMDEKDQKQLMVILTNKLASKRKNPHGIILLN